MEPLMMPDLRHDLRPVLKTVHKLKFKSIYAVQMVDSLLCGRVIDFACSDVSIQNLIGEAQIFLVGLWLQTVDWSFVHKHGRKP